MRKPCIDTINCNTRTHTKTKVTGVWETNSTLQTITTVDEQMLDSRRRAVLVASLTQILRLVITSHRVDVKTTSATHVVYLHVAAWYQLLTILSQQTPFNPHTVPVNIYIMAHAVLWFSLWQSNPYQQHEPVQVTHFNNMNQYKWHISTTWTSTSDTFQQREPVQVIHFNNVKL